MESETRIHLAALDECIDFRRVPDDHPLRVLWRTPTSKARFDAHHLADDVVAVKHVAGFQGLLKRMVEDSEAFEDYRYELRIAASLARSAGQQVLRLAGNQPGADIEFKAKSGHTCGVACYRARKLTPAVQEVSGQCARVVKGFLSTFSAIPVPVALGLEVIYPRFPVTKEDEQCATRLLAQMWRTPNQCEHTDASGVGVKRCVQLRHAEDNDARRRARLRFMFEIPARERRRIDRHLKDKLIKENKSWASKFAGKPLLAIEETGLSSGLSNDDLSPVVRSDETTFSGIISTQLVHPSFDGIVHGLEEVSYSVSPPDLHLGLCTFGQNSTTWSGDHPTVQLYPTHACEFWDLWQDGKGTHARCSRPLSLERRMKRLDDRVGSFHELKNRPDVIERLAQASIDMRDESAAAFDW